MCWQETQLQQWLRVSPQRYAAFHRPALNLFGIPCCKRHWLKLKNLAFNIAVFMFILLPPFSHPMPAIRTTKTLTGRRKPGPKASRVQGGNAVSAPKLNISTLAGEVPPWSYSNHVVDDEAEIVILNTYQYNKEARNGFSELWICDVRHKEWRNLTTDIEFISHIGAPPVHQPLPPRVCAAMEFHKYNNGQRIVLLFGGQINGLDKKNLGEVSAQMIAIDIGTQPCKWWVLPIAGGDVVPRVDASAELLVANDRLFVFGGREYVNGKYHWLHSYSVATLANNQWTWTVRDVDFPANVQALGACGPGVAIRDGRNAAQILLTFEHPNVDVNDVIWNRPLGPQSFVVYDVASGTFAPQIG
ncbi:hypothetical protein B0H19DRAFT_1226130, partial [Mycena capillaripes]